MSFIQDRVEGVNHYARKTFFGVIGVALAILACMCFALAIWEIIQIFFITTWMTLKAAGLVLVATISIMLMIGSFSIAGRGRRRGRKVVVLPPENVHSMRIDEFCQDRDMVVVWEKGTKA